MKRSWWKSANDRAAKERRESRAEKRADESHEQTLRERKTNLQDTSRERNLLMTLTTTSVIATIFFAGCTVIFLALTAKYAQPWGYAASAASFGLTTIASLTAATPKRFQMLLSLAKSGGEGTERKGSAED